jgi:hypothetical protein
MDCAAKAKRKIATSQTLPGYQLPIVPVFGDNLAGLPVGLEHETRKRLRKSALTIRSDALFAVDDNSSGDGLKYLTRRARASQKQKGERKEKKKTTATVNTPRVSATNCARLRR